MEACAFKDESVLSSATFDASMIATQPILRKTMTINICGVMQTAYKDEFEKEIYKSLYEPFMLNSGA